MKFVLLAAVLLVSACMQETEMVSATESATEAQFNSTVVGQNMVTADGGSVLYSADGTFSGSSDGLPLNGVWRFENGQYCRSGSVGDFSFPDACEPVIIDGNTVTFIGPDLTIVYTIA